MLNDTVVQYPGGMPPMDMKRYYDKNPHLRPVQEESQAHQSQSQSVQGTPPKTMSEMVNLAK